MLEMLHVPIPMSNPACGPEGISAGNFFFGGGGGGGVLYWAHC